MKTIMSAKSPHDTSFSFSRRYFHWKKKPLDEEEEEEEDQEREEEREILNHTTSFSHFQEPPRKSKRPHFSRSKLKSALLTLPFTKRPPSLGTRVVGTLFGHRRGHVRFAFQENPKLGPAFLLELPTPTSLLVREMASGLVRIALECDKPNKGGANTSRKLLEEPLWRSYCNGRKCGYANRRQCGPEDWAVLRAVEPISMGAGVLPVSGGVSDEGEVMYMRARYERVVGSKDSEAFYMMNPDGTGGPELSIYFIRV
ncbi:protein MIZU-KUSSEI 1 [Cajanus cajan]|uniref:Protein MIZU-KUSSEI 1 n=1 Tax=Cajanus cajan TaxID=3821 RepID=A0A151R9K6_CAJCA|nr:protein MIZU-KUSSEI 1 [Cajanus cajan]KYP39173.1 hypothetical protein KK1_039537 [Cajanus cajan]